MKNKTRFGFFLFYSWGLAFRGAFFPSTFVSFSCSLFSLLLPKVGRGPDAGPAGSCQRRLLLRGT